MTSKRWLLALLFSLSCLAGAGPAEAHPHAWIDYTVKIVFDRQERITGIEESWLFDDFYSQFALEGVRLDENGDPEQKDLEQIMHEDLHNLGDYHYFTDLWIGNTKLKSGAVHMSSIGMREKRLWMSFFLPLEKPAGATGEPFRYSIYDPSYYVEMLHAE